MINVRSCDICHAALGSAVTRLELVRGDVIFLPRDRWAVGAHPAGMRQRMVCPACDQYLREAVQHLALLVSPSGDAAAPADQHAVA